MKTNELPRNELRGIPAKASSFSGSSSPQASEVFAQKNKYICIIGNAGAGKTTAAEVLARHFHAKIITEPFVNNPFFPLFIKNPRRWAFANELYFLYERSKGLAEIHKSLLRQSVVADSGFLMSPFVYVKAQYKLGRMKDIEWQFYQKILPLFQKDAPQEDLVVYIKASPRVCFDRIKRRKSLRQGFHSLSYLEMLHQSLEELKSQLKRKKKKLVEIDSGEINFLQEKGKEKLIHLVEARL